jgi:hypothetical protein
LSGISLPVPYQALSSKDRVYQERPFNVAKIDLSRGNGISLLPWTVSMDAAACWPNRGWMELKNPRTVTRAKPHKVIRLILASEDL